MVRIRRSFDCCSTNAGGHDNSTEQVSCGEFSVVDYISISILNNYIDSNTYIYKHYSNDESIHVLTICYDVHFSFFLHSLLQ